MKGKVKTPYKQLPECGRPISNGLHPVGELQHQLQNHQHQVQYEESARRNHTHLVTFLVIAVLTLIVAVISISAQAILFKEYYDLKNEVDLQMQMLDMMSKNRDSNSATTEPFMETHSDPIGEVKAFELQQSHASIRTKRSDEPPKNRNPRNRNRHGRGEARTQSEVTVLHMVINTKHPDAPSPLKTGPRGSVIKYWKYSDDLFNEQQTFGNLDINSGHLTIAKSGLYYIYSQMTYFDRSGRWSHQVSIDEQPFIKCLASEWGIEEDPDTGALYNTIHQCHTAAVTFIRRGQKVTIRSMYPDRVIHADKDMTFAGLLKLT